MSSAGTRGATWVGPACAIGAAVLYGTSWVAAGMALEAFTPFAAAVWRALITIAVLLPVLVWLRGRPSAAVAKPTAGWRRGRLLRMIVLGAMGGAVFGIGMNIAINLTGVAITAFIAGGYPVIAAAAAPLILGERTRPVAIVGLVLAFVGTLLIAGFDLAGIRLEGTLVGAATAVVTGLYLLLTRRWSRAWSIGPVEIAFSNFVMLGLAASVAVIVVGEPLLPAAGSERAWLATLWLGVVAGAIATALLAESLRRLPASESSAYLMLNPLTGALLAIPLLGEVIAPVELLGGALVLLGIGLATGTVALVVRAVTGRRALEPAPTMGPR
jgi:probable blue pigment (indigoidine) exporter